MFEFAISNAVIASVLACVAFVVTRFWRHPVVAHTLWLLVLLKFLTPTLVTFDAIGLIAAKSNANDRPSTNWENPGEPIHSRAASSLFTAATPAFEQIATSPNVASSTSVGAIQIWAVRLRNISWQTTLATIWGGGICLIGIPSLVRMFRFHRQIQRLSDSPSRRVGRMANELSAKFEFSRTPQIRILPYPISPMVWTFAGKTYVLLPAQLLEELDDRQTRSLLAHEFAHVRRRDHWLRWLEFACVLLYWWCPVIWVARRELRRAEEECCDAEVARHFADEEHAYVTTLLKTVEFLIGTPRKLPVTASGIGQATILKRRIEMILSGTPGSIRFGRPLAIAAMCALLPWGISLQAESADSASETLNTAKTTDETSKTPDLDDLGDSIEPPSEPLNSIEVRPAIKSIAAKQELSIGDLKFKLHELLKLNSFAPLNVTQDQNVVLDNLDSPMTTERPYEEPASSTLTFEKTSRVFSSVTYQRPSPFPDYFKFVVHGRYDATTSHQRLVEQVSEVLGEPHDTKRNLWLCETTLDDKEMILEFRVDRKSGREGPSLHIVLRFRPDW